MGDEAEPLGRTDAPISTDRRHFLRGSLVGAAGAVAAQAAPAVAAPAPPAAPAAGAAGEPSPWLRAAETAPPPPTPVPQQVEHPGSDFMTDCMREAGIEFVALCPGSTFRGLQESLQNYAGAPKMIVCTHEEISAGICHGYAKASGKSMACMVHSNVGLQHASMAIFNAWCDRAPMMVIAGNAFDATKRRPGVEWIHSAVDVGVIVRDYVKYDDAPVSLQHYAESFMRAQAVSLSAPAKPVMIVTDSDLQEEGVEHGERLTIPKLSIPAPPVADTRSLAAAARLLAAAKAPVIMVDRAARNQAGVDLLVRLAETLNAPVVDLIGRMNFPTSHYLNHGALQGRLVGGADVILALELTDLWGALNTVPDVVGRPSRRNARPDCKVISISADYLYSKSNMADLQRYSPADLALAAETQATLPLLIEAIAAELSPAQKAVVAERAGPARDTFQRLREDARRDAAIGWEASPISTARLCQELWAQVRNRKWALNCSSTFLNRWPQRLWDMTEYEQFLGASGGYGIGYGPPAAIGAAIAFQGTGRMTLNIQGDGDLLMVPGALWTMAHHSLPILNVMHNNRAWHQEVMHLQRMANWRQRDPTKAREGTAISEPNVDFAMLAKSMGMWAEGPISDPAKLGPAITRALAVIDSGKPALLDVVTQPR